MEEKKQQVKIEKEKRKWYQIIGPKIFGGRLIGETIGESIEKISGRVLELSAGMVSGDMKKQYMTLIFVLNSGDNNTLNASITGLKVSQSYLKRGMRRFKGKIEDSFAVKCLEGDVRIKVMLLLRGEVHKAVSGKLVKLCREISGKFTEGKKIEDLVLSVLNDSFSRGIKEGLKRVYPVASVEVKYLAKE